MKLTKKEMQTILDKFAQEYNFAYEANERGQEVGGSNEAVDFFDYYFTHKGSALFHDCIVQLATFRGDFFSSDREVASITFALDSLGYLDKMGL